MNAGPQNARRGEEAPELWAEPRGQDRLFADGRIPSRGAWLAAFLLVLLRRRWTLSFLAATAAFSLLALLLPGLLSPQPPAASGPDSHRLHSRRAPYLEKAFRLRAAGDLFAEAGDPVRARDLFARALNACRTHLEREPSEPIRLQVQLGMALLQERLGDGDSATEALANVAAAAAGTPVAGVAHYHLGRLCELTRHDTAGALKHYEAAKGYAAASSPLDPLERVGELLNDRNGDRRTAYGVAGLTATHVNAAALEGEIDAALRRLSGKGTGARGPAATPPDEADDPLVIVQGK